MDAELVKIKNLAEKEVTRRRKAAVKMLAKYDDFPGGRGGLNLVAGARRSEEHTSELQSPLIISYAVFCLKKTFF